MGFNFHVGLPGPFSYTKRIGGGGPSARQQLQEARVQGALRDIYCPEHLRINNAIDYALVVLAALLVAVFTGWWAVLGGLVVAAIVAGCHRARARRRAAFGLASLATGAGCHRCQVDAGRDAERAELQPLGGRHRR